MQGVPENEIDILKEEEDLKLTMMLEKLSIQKKKNLIIIAYDYLNTKIKTLCPCNSKKEKTALEKQTFYPDKFSSNQTQYSMSTKHSFALERYDSQYYTSIRIQQMNVIRYNNKWRERWDIIIIVFAIYNCIELPLEIAYQWRKDFDKDDVSNYLNHVIDSLFFIDILLNFRTTFINKQTGEEIINTRQIVH